MGRLGLQDACDGFRDAISLCSNVKKRAGAVVIELDTQVRLRRAIKSAAASVAGAPIIDALTQRPMQVRSSA